jgi:hypothetical protein
VAGGDDQLRGDEVLPERPDVAPRRHRRPQSNGIRLIRLDGFNVFDRDDGVRPPRQSVACVDVDRLGA